MTGENWTRAYIEAPELFDAFARAEDPEGCISELVTREAGLAGRDVLEIGCGTGRYTSNWAGRAGSYLAVERSPQMLAVACREATADLPARWICADARRLPLTGGSVDRVLAGWVVANLKRKRREQVRREIARLLRPDPGAEVWLIENHWSGEFQQLRERACERERLRLLELCSDWRLEVAHEVRTSLAFPSAAEAERVLGYLLGDRVRQALRARPVMQLTHHVVLLRGRPHAG